MEQNKINYVLGVLRIIMGWIFLWAFIDKLFGLGFATLSEKAWLTGSSPTAGFLQFGVHGPLASFYQSLAGSAFIDWLFMFGLLFIGVSLTLGIFIRLGGFSAILLLFLMYTAVGMSPENNPFIDDHIVYMFVILLFILMDSGRYFGLGKWWSETSLVKKFSIFR